MDVRRKLLCTTVPVLQSDRRSRYSFNSRPSKTGSATERAYGLLRRRIKPSVFTSLKLTLLMAFVRLILPTSALRISVRPGLQFPIPAVTSEEREQRLFRFVGICRISVLYEFDFWLFHQIILSRTGPNIASALAVSCAP